LPLAANDGHVVSLLLFLSSLARSLDVICDTTRARSRFFFVVTKKPRPHELLITKNPKYKNCKRLQQKLREEEEKEEE